MELFDTRVTLFESIEEDEHLLVTAESTGVGGLLIRQMSEGDLTRFCFEESPHVVETFVSPKGVRTLENFFDVTDSNQVVRMLGISFADYDCAQRVRALLCELGVSFEVLEHAVDRKTVALRSAAKVACFAAV